MDCTNNLFSAGKKNEYIKMLKEKVKSVMTDKLFLHTIGTLNYASKLSKLYIFKNSLYSKKDISDICERLHVSCILHDYGKIFTYDQLLVIAKEDRLKISNFELNSPSLLHSFIGDYLVFRDFNINDKKILNSIKFHSIGYCNMSIEDKILFVSDKIEETRNYGKVDYFRKLSLKNLNITLQEIYKDTIIYVINNNKLLHPDTSKIWNNICGGEKNAQG